MFTDFSDIKTFHGHIKTTFWVFLSPMAYYCGIGERWDFLQGLIILKSFSGIYIYSFSNVIASFKIFSVIDGQKFIATNWIEMQCGLRFIDLTS